MSRADLVPVGDEARLTRRKVTAVRQRTRLLRIETPNALVAMGGQKMRSILLYFLGIPIPIILLLAFCTHHF